MKKYFSKIMKNFPIIDINQQKGKKKPTPTPPRGGMDGRGMRNENGKDENHGNAGVRGRRRGNIKVKGNMRKNGINNYGIWGGNMYIIYV